MADGTDRNSAAINRMKSRFETNSNSMATTPPVKTPVKPSYLKTSAPNGSVQISSVKASDKSPSNVDVNSNSIPEKLSNRRSQLNIPAAFLQQNTDDKMMKPKPPPPGKKPNFRDNDTTGESGTSPTTPVKQDKPTPPWKKPVETTKPDPPWKKKPLDNGTSATTNDVKSDKPLPAWKQAILDRQKEKEGESKTESDGKTEKPLPPWKQKKVEPEDKPVPPWKQNKTEPDEKPVPPWKQKKTETEDKPVPPWKQKKEDTEDKPVPAWKRKDQQNDSDALPIKPTPPWKQKSEVQSPDGSSSKPLPPPASAKPRQDLPSPGSATPGLPGSVSVKKNDLESAFKNLKHFTPKSKDEPVLLRNTGGSVLKRKMSRKSYTRTLDDKKFFLIDVDDMDTSSIPPPKPAKLVNFAELERIIADYKAQVENHGDEEAEEVIEEDIYEPIPADEEEEAAPVMRSNSAKRSMNRQSSKIQSMIPTMDSDEEEAEYQDTATAPPVPSLPPPIDNLAPPPVSRLPPRSPGHSPLPPRPPPKVAEADQEEEYNDCDVLEEEVDGELEQDELYEPLDEIQNEVEKIDEQKRREEEEEQKRKEVERKKKEEEDKKEAARKEKQRKEDEKRQKKEKERQEKEMKKIIKQLKLKPIDLDKSQGEGIIKRDDKGGKLGLEVSVGDRIVIIKINDCPPGKWVCKMAKTGRVGYVECDNVEIDNSLIKSENDQVMVGTFTNPSDLPPPPQELLEGEEYDDFETGEPDQEEYDDVSDITPQQDELYEPI